MNDYDNIATCTNPDLKYKEKVEITNMLPKIWSEIRELLHAPGTFGTPPSSGPSAASTSYCSRMIYKEQTRILKIVKS